MPTDGLPPLQKAIIRYTAEHCGRLVAPENVILSNGAKQAIYNKFQEVRSGPPEVREAGPKL